MATNDSKGSVGRPLKMTDMVLKKLEEAFALGCSDAEACFYAEISHQTLYNYQHKHPLFIERKEALKQNPILLARQSVVKGLVGNPELALKYLERKLKKEFSLRSEFTGADGKDLPTPIMSLDNVQRNDSHPENQSSPSAD